MFAVIIGFVYLCTYLWTMSGPSLEWFVRVWEMSFSVYSATCHFRLHLTFYCPNKFDLFSLQRNYRFFFTFVSSTSMLCLYVFAFSWVNLWKIMNAYHCNLWSAFLKSPVSGILVLYTFIAVWFVGGLTTFHLYLIFTNQVPISSLPLYCCLLFHLGF